MSLRFKQAMTGFRSRQRFQIGMADANRAPFAEQLKFGTTQLLVDMVEAGWLKDVPRLRRPLRALATYNQDSSLLEKASGYLPGKERRGSKLSALEIQHWFLEEAKQFVDESPLGKEESYYREICRLWGETLDLLEKEPELLIGKIDWITKQFLLQTETGEDLDPLQARRIDLGYHEIGNGYFDRLEHTGYISCLIDQESLMNAEFHPPSVASAQARSRFIKNAASNKRVAFWTHGYDLSQGELSEQSVEFS